MTRPLVTIVKNIIALLLREGSSKGVYLLFSVIIARRYGRELLGQYVLAFLIPRLFFMLSEMGLNTFLTREVAKAKETVHSYVVNLGFLKTFLGVLTLFMLMLCARLLYPSGPLFPLLALGGASYFIISYLHLFNAAFRAFEKMEVEARILIFRDLLFLVAGLLWVWRWEDLRLLLAFFLAANKEPFISFMLLLMETKAPLSSIVMMVRANTEATIRYIPGITNKMNPRIYINTMAILASM